MPLSQVTDIQEYLVASLLSAGKIDHSLEEGNRPAEKPQEHDSVPEQGCKEPRIGMHHEGAETPQCHEKHVLKERGIDFFLSAVNAENDEDDIDDEGQGRNKRRCVQYHVKNL